MNKPTIAAKLGSGAFVMICMAANEMSWRGRAFSQMLRCMNNAESSFSNIYHYM